MSVLDTVKSKHHGHVRLQGLPEFGGVGRALSRWRVCDGPAGDAAVTRPEYAIPPVNELSTPTTQPSDDDGIDGIIIDHYFPEPPPDPPEKKTAASAAMRAAAVGSRQRAIKKPPPRTQWLLKQYSPNITTTGSVDDFIKTAFDAVKAHDGKFGISTSMSQFAQPHSNAKKWLQQGWCDYFMPELYVQDLPTFQDALDNWNQLNTVQPASAKPQIVPVLFTSAVETARQHRAAVGCRRHRGAGPSRQELQNPGQAHYSARALRSPAAGGPPRPNHDVGDKLKANHYKDPAVPPPAAHAWVNSRTRKLPLVSTRRTSASRTMKSGVSWSGSIAAPAGRGPRRSPQRRESSTRREAATLACYTFTRSGSTATDARRREDVRHPVEVVHRRGRIHRRAGRRDAQVQVCRRGFARAVRVRNSRAASAGRPEPSSTAPGAAATRRPGGCARSRHSTAQSCGRGTRTTRRAV